MFSIGAKNKERFLSAPEAYNYGVEFARILLTTGFLFGIYNVFANALKGILFAQPVTDALSLLLSVICFMISYRKLLGNQSTIQKNSPIPVGD